MATILDKLSQAASTGRERAVGAMRSLRGAPVSTGTPAPVASPATASAAPPVSDVPAYQRSEVMDRVNAVRAGGAGNIPPVREAPFDPGAGRPGPRPLVDMATPYEKGLRVPAVSTGSRLASFARGVTGVPGLVGAAALTGGMAAGSKAVDSIYSGVIDRAYGANTNPSTRIDSNGAAEISKIVADNPNGMTARFLRGENPSAAAAPAATTGVINDNNFVQPTAVQSTGMSVNRLTGDAAQAAARGIRSGAISIPNTAGNGYVVASDGSGGTQFTTGTPGSGNGGGGSQPASVSPRDVALRTLQSEATADFGDPLVGRRGRREAANSILDFEAKKDATAATRATTAAATAKNAAELDDKRVKEFNEQFVNNQFSLTNTDKNGKVSQTPDIERNAKFLDFARQVDPRFASPEGIVQLSQLPAQDRSKLVSDIRKRFVEKEQVEKVTNDGAFLKFDKPGLSNAPVQVSGAREATVGDIPDIGLGNYIYSNLPFTNRDVVGTDRGALLAEDYIGDSTTEGSLDRRRRIYGSK